MRPGVVFAARWTFAVGVLVAVLSRLDASAVFARAGDANPLVVAPAIVGLVAVHLVAVVSWRRLLRALAGVNLPWPAAARAYYAGQAIGSLTPGNIGADVYRVAAVDVGATRRSLALVIVAQRITATIALGLLAGVAAGVGLPSELGLPDPAGAAGLAITAAVVGLAIAVSIVERRRSFGVRDGEGASRSRRSAVRSVLVEGFGLGLAFHAASIALGFLIVLAIDPAASAHTSGVLAALAIARLALVLPVTPSGIGVQEGALGILFVTLGLPPDVAVAAMLLNRLALVATILLGLGFLVTGRRTPARDGARGAQPRVRVRARAAVYPTTLAVPGEE